jgi:hypothetical protein
MAAASLATHDPYRPNVHRGMRASVLNLPAQAIDLLQTTPPRPWMRSHRDWSALGLRRRDRRIDDLAAAAAVGPREPGLC